MERISDILFEIKLYFRHLWWLRNRKSYFRGSKGDVLKQKVEQYRKDNPNSKIYVAKPNPADEWVEELTTFTEADYKSIWERRNGN